LSSESNSFFVELFSKRVQNYTLFSFIQTF